MSSPGSAPSTFLALTMAVYRYCAVPAPWLPLFRHPDDPTAPNVYYICFTCLAPYTDGGCHSTCDTCIAAGFQRAEDAGRPVYLPDFVTYKGLQYKRFGDKLGRTPVQAYDRAPNLRTLTRIRRWWICLVVTRPQILMLIPSGLWTSLRGSYILQNPRR